MNVTERDQPEISPTGRRRTEAAASTKRDVLDEFTRVNIKGGKVDAVTMMATSITGAGTIGGLKYGTPWRLHRSRRLSICAAVRFLHPVV